jgi:anti-sigma regulatory factor (Ser/Thr protein kinase)
MSESSFRDSRGEAHGPRLPLTVPFAGGPDPDHPNRAIERFEPREHTLDADINQLKGARDFAERAAAELGFNDDDRYQVKLAVSEAVTNAIEHGSSSPQDPIRITVSVQARALVFEVFDTGRFVPRVMRGGDMPAGGRGLEFMRLMMDEVDLRPGTDGTRLRLSKRLR